MTDIAFYHLTTSSAADVLPLLVHKTRKADKKALVCSDQSNITALSSALWSLGDQNEEFLPHGIAGKDDADADLCPIWFAGDTGENSVTAEFSFYLDGISPHNANSFDRVFIIFNGLDENAVSTARIQWKTLRDEGHALSYWTQDESRSWKKTA